MRTKQTDSTNETRKRELYEEIQALKGKEGYVVLVNESGREEVLLDETGLPEVYGSEAEATTLAGIESITAQTEVPLGFKVVSVKERRNHTSRLWAAMVMFQ